MMVSAAKGRGCLFLTGHALLRVVWANAQRGEPADLRACKLCLVVYHMKGERWRLVLHAPSG